MSGNTNSSFPPAVYGEKKKETHDIPCISSSSSQRRGADCCQNPKSSICTSSSTLSAQDKTMTMSETASDERNLKHKASKHSLPTAKNKAMLQNLGYPSGSPANSKTRIVAEVDEAVEIVRAPRPGGRYFDGIPSARMEDMIITLASIYKSTPRYNISILVLPKVKGGEVHFTAYAARVHQGTSENIFSGVEGKFMSEAIHMLLEQASKTMAAYWPPNEASQKGSVPGAWVK